MTTAKILTNMAYKNCWVYCSTNGCLNFKVVKRGTKEYIAVRSTLPCIPPESLNRVLASTEVRAGMSALPGGR